MLVCVCLLTCLKGANVGEALDASLDLDSPEVKFGKMLAGSDGMCFVFSFFSLCSTLKYDMKRSGDLRDYV